MMKIAFIEIGRDKTRLQITDTGWLPTEFDSKTEDISAEISYRLSTDDMVELEGKLRGCVLLDCARCGDGVQHDLQEDFYYRITTREEELSELPERECSDEECDTLYLKDPVIDVTEIFQEQLYLALPGKVLCSGQCKGLCPECGKVLNRETCSCSDMQPDSPFAVLKKLKKD